MARLKVEKPRHRVYLTAYWIDQTEITNAMFARFVDETGHQTEAEKEGSGCVCGTSSGGCDCLDGANWRHPQGPESDLTGLSNHPVVQVSWNDATAYCQWAGRRLPTEAFCTKAAGGADGRKWPWGNEPPTEDLANICDVNCEFGWKDDFIDDGYEFTSPVGTYSTGASLYDALDMAGNISEWVNDTYASDYYASSPDANPQGPTLEGSKVLRGGSWYDTAPGARVRYRDTDNGGYRRFNFWGFRCASLVP